MSRSGPAFGLAIAVAAIIGVGCGGGGSDEDQVRDVVTSFVEAGKNRDAEEACSLLASDQVKVVERLGHGAGCEQVLGGILAKAQVSGTDLKIEDVRVEGDRATVDATVKRVRRFAARREHSPRQGRRRVEAGKRRALSG